MHTGLAQRVPESHLIAGEHWPTKIFFECCNRTNCAEAVPAKEYSFSRGRDLRARECINLRGIHLGKLAQRVGRLRDSETPKAHLVGVNDVESLAPKVRNS